MQVQFGEQPADVLRGAADEVLGVLKDTSRKDPDKQGVCEELLGPLPADKFAQLVAIGKLITDWVAPGEVDEAAASAQAMDTELGVGVQFEDEDEDEEGDEEGDVVVDDDDADDDEEGGWGQGRRREGVGRQQRACGVFVLALVSWGGED